MNKCEKAQAVKKKTIRVVNTVAAWVGRCHATRQGYISLTATCSMAWPLALGAHVLVGRPIKSVLGRVYRLIQTGFRTFHPLEKKRF